MPVFRLLHSARQFRWPFASSTQGVVTVLFVACLAGIEIFGRFAKSDLHDMMFAIGLVGLIVSLLSVHRRSPLPWVHWIRIRGERLARRISRWQFEKGIDFRGSPPIPRRTPPSLLLITSGLVLWGTIAVGIWYWLPGGWRELGLKTSYVLYLVVLLSLWSALFLNLAIGLGVPVFLLDRTATLQRMSDGDRRSVTLFVFLGYLFLVLSISTMVPMIPAVAVCVLAAGAALAKCLFAGSAGVSFIFKSRSDYYSIPLIRLIAFVVFIAIAFCLDLVLMATCGRITTRVEPGDVMPATAMLASWVVWTMPLLLGIVAYHVWHASRANPARITPPTVQIDTHLAWTDWTAARRAIRGWGWRVRGWGQPPEPGDVGIRLVKEAESEATEFEPRWPLKLALSDLANPNVRDRLLRRDEIQLRRRFIRGMKRAFKLISRVRRTEGGGYWLAPQWWFFHTMAREEPAAKSKSDQPESIVRRFGPTYEELLGRRSRQHWYTILRAVQLDVIYWEDGVPAKSIERVLRKILSLYDRTGGGLAADDRHFHGIPKIRVVIHEFSPNRPLAITQFKQPKFDDLSRGRILHIFRDKGEGEELFDIPFDFHSAPSPMASV